jgi:hypothetical protein
METEDYRIWAVAVWLIVLWIVVIGMGCFGHGSVLDIGQRMDAIEKRLDK